ncbi:hypothetical protein [Actinomadura sp. 7K507]|uniref:hypothetical protein n=1 Tax=Actinomadura sp. 7K507 TaxID=2530365 RepID=UPI0010515D73|nr:hypothetical protein [Actinomadura sp. 7K507]TDC74171.1 hypothetical protein E1285_43690 [Actinomadura sp. 7K507]
MEISKETIMHLLHSLAKQEGEVAWAAKTVIAAITVSSPRLFKGTRVLAGEILPSYRARKDVMQETSIESPSVESFICSLEKYDSSKELILIWFAVPSWNVSILMDPADNSAVSCILVKR